VGGTFVGDVADYLDKLLIEIRKTPNVENSTRLLQPLRSLTNWCKNLLASPVANHAGIHFVT